MDNSGVLQWIREVGLLPVLRASSVEEAMALAWAIEAGGVTVLEVTMTVPGAIEVIRHLVRESSGRILIGAGTVLDPETARACMLAGAQFILNPAPTLGTLMIFSPTHFSLLPRPHTPPHAFLH